MMMDSKGRGYRLSKMVSNHCIKAPSTLIRFQTKTELFWSVFKKRVASTFIVFESFSLVHTTTPYPFENAFIPSVRILKWTRRMRISIYRPRKLATFSILCCCWLNALATASKDQERSHMEPSVRHFGYSRSFSNRSTLESVFEWLRFRWSFSAL